LITFLGRRRVMNLSNDGKRENRFYHNSTFERMEMSKGRFEA
jgi:hypothetical protein